MCLASEGSFRLLLTVCMFFPRGQRLRSHFISAPEGKSNVVVSPPRGLEPSSTWGGGGALGQSAPDFDQKTTRRRHHYYGLNPAPLCDKLGPQGQEEGEREWRMEAEGTPLLWGPLP